MLFSGPEVLGGHGVFSPSVFLAFPEHCLVIPILSPILAGQQFVGAGRENLHVSEFMVIDEQENQI